jgi:nucleotide-binding universal stress UspA family protein
MTKKILVALDGSTQAGKALDLAVDMAKPSNAELAIIHIISDKPLTEGERRLAETEYQAEVREALSGPGFSVGPSTPQADAGSFLKTSYDVGLAIRTVIGRRILDGAAANARGKGLSSVRTMLADGDPADMLVQAAEKEKPDLLVMGSRGIGGIQGLFMGSVSHKVSHLVACSVVIVK